MNELIQDSREELKRIDHLIYVTLKYTRTVDVLLSIVERMINSYAIAIDAILEKGKELGVIEDVPDIPLEKAKVAKKVLDKKIVKDNINQYLLFRKLHRSKNYEKASEYRRHVAMRTIIDGEMIEINIDNITEKYHTIKKFVTFVSDWIDTQ